MTASTLESRLRQIAILVASVDTTAARQLLMHLPTEIAKRVRAMAADIGPVPPEERRALLAEFQKSQAQLKTGSRSVNSASVENAAHQDLTAKAFADFTTNLNSNFNSNFVNQVAVEPSSPTWTRLGVDALVRLVRLERPTVIAVVLQQLPAPQVAAVLQRLPRSVTKEALHALGGLQDIDAEAMRAIDEHLSERLRDYHHKIESELEQTRRINELLAAAPPEMKQQWASWMRPEAFAEESSPMSSTPVSATATAMNTLDNLYRSATITTSDSQWIAANGQVKAAAATSAAPVHGSASPTTNTQPPSTPEATPTVPAQGLATIAAKANNEAQPTDVDDGPRTLPFPGAQPRRNGSPDSNADRGLLQKNMERLLTLAPERLAQLLSSLDSHTVLMAMAGASTRFMKRFCNMLEPSDAKVLEDRIERIGQVSLRQIDDAQQRLIDAYFAFISPVGQSRAA